MSRHPSDLPPLEYATPRFQHRIEWIAFRGVGMVFHLLPRVLIKLLLQGLIVIAKFSFRKRIAPTLITIQDRLQVSKERAASILDESLLHFGWNWVSLIRPEVFIRPGKIHIHGQEYLDQNRNNGKGTIIATMHLGLWEAVPHAMKAFNNPLAITVAVQHNPLVDRHINKMRAAEGYHHVLHNRLGIRHTLRYLKKGGSLVIVSDVDIGPGGVPIPFLGKPASTPKWPMELALRTESEILIGHSVLDKNNELHIYISPLPTGENETMALGQRMNDKMSEIVRAHPEQWFWMQRRWKTPIEACRNP
jgi:Kdo2-lipid IVA lauroyltransferase/acyltransferase